MRFLVGAVLMALACLVVAPVATATDAVSFGTDWKAEAEHGGYYQAIATGIYTRHGLDVTLRQGGPQVNHAQLLAAGRLDFNIAPNSFIPLNFVQQSIPMVAVAAIFQKDPSVLIAHPGEGNDSLAALKGKPIMIGSDTRITSWTFLKSKFGYSDDQIRPYTFSVAPFLADPKAIQQGYLSSEPFTIEAQGIKPVVLLLADAGYSSYGSLIQTSNKRVRQNPDLVQRFVDASIEGWYSYLYGDPAPGNASDQARQSGNDRRIARLRDREDQGIWHCRRRRGQDRRHRGDERGTMARLLRHDVEGRRLPQGSRLPQSLHLAIRQQEGGYEALTISVTTSPLPASGRVTPLVTLQGITKRFASGTMALDAIDLEIFRGEFLSLLGPSGCGKSTLVADHRRARRAQ